MPEEHRCRDFQGGEAGVSESGEEQDGPIFDHEKLDVYRASLNYCSQVHSIAQLLSGMERLAPTSGFERLSRYR